MKYWLKYWSSKASAESEGNDEDNGGEEEKEAESEDGSEWSSPRIWEIISTGNHCHSFTNNLSANSGNMKYQSVEEC